jgi:signal transduction histidine kinase
MIGLVRLLLAFASLVIIYIDPTEPDKHVALTYLSLVLYTIYSAAVYSLSLRRDAGRPRRLTHWVDVACYLVLISLSSGTNSVYFFFFFFAIIVASFRFGFPEGMRVTIASAALFSVIGYATTPGGVPFEIDRFLLRPVYLLTLGYMTAYWGGCEIKLTRQLGLLRSVTRLSNPRFDVGYTIGSMLWKLREFYDADHCLIVLADPRDNEYRLFRLRREQTAEAVQAELVPAPLAREQERRRLARDIHDSVIQPYIGLQYKLAAIRNKAAEGRELGEDIERLFEMTVEEVAGLRGFVRGLKDGEGRADNFVSAVQRFAAQFAQNYDLDVKVQSKGDFRVNDRLAAELIKIVHEGLSNIRKHSSATAGKITLERADRSLRISIENDDPRADDGTRPPFTPRSITERAEELGGHVAVEQTADARTLVRVEIPL